MNIVFTGSFGAGKTTVGKKLAKNLGYSFVDPDDLIVESESIPLQQIIDEKGEDYYLQKESEIIINLKNLDRTVISPGACFIFNETTVAELKKNAIFIFLDADLKTIKINIPDITTRGIIGLKDSTLEDAYNKRVTLCKKYADVSINVSGPRDMSKILNEVLQFLKRHKYMI